jgi:pantothenate kinase type III
MVMRLCIDVGRDQVKCGLFQDSQCIKAFKIRTFAELKTHLQGVSIKEGLLVCNDPIKAQEWERQISLAIVPIKIVKTEDFSSRAAPEAKNLLLPDTIAKIYGALSYHPTNDCLMIDFGTTIRYELISKQGLLLGRCIFPFFDLLYRSLETTPFNFEDQIPPPIGLNPVDAVTSGCFFGVLGSVERVISEIRLSSPNPSELLTIATGALTEKPCWKNPICELIDELHPHLVLEGLNQILNEGIYQ